MNPSLHIREFVFLSLLNVRRMGSAVKRDGMAGTRRAGGGRAWGGDCGGSDVYCRVGRGKGGGRRVCILGVRFLLRLRSFPCAWLLFFLLCVLPS